MRETEFDIPELWDVFFNFVFCKFVEFIAQIVAYAGVVSVLEEVGYRDPRVKEY